MVPERMFDVKSENRTYVCIPSRWVLACRDTRNGPEHPDHRPTRRRVRTVSDITARQQRILDFIERTVRERGYPPTVREIGDAVGLTSSSSVHAQLANLERKGLLTKDPSKPRAMTLSDDRRAEGTPVPLIGRIAAGEPVLADEHVEDRIMVPTEFVRGRRSLRPPRRRRVDDRRRHPRRRRRRHPEPALGQRRRHRGRAPAGARRGRGHREAPRSRRRARDAHPREPRPRAVRDGGRAHPRQGRRGPQEASL